MKSDECGDVAGKFQRIPGFARPSHYTIHLKTHLDTCVFEGQEEINIEVEKPTNYFQLYSKGLDVQEASFVAADGKAHGLLVNYDQKWDHLNLSSTDELPAGTGILKMKFQGKLLDEMQGLYRSKYTGSDGKQRYMATTQFESIYARQAFPCYDEPVYKATFDISMTVPSGQTALSNAREVSMTDAGDGWTTVKFARTPKMSSYLVAFIVSELEYVETMQDGVRIRVYTVPGKKEQGKFALDVCAKAIAFYGKYFGIPYAMDKCDLIAIPDFNMGAMENWGLVTYREVYLLWDEALSSVLGKQNIAIVVGHEIAHMWFGNLVTMEWWTDLWLKEGYATFMEYFFAHAAFPDWDMWTQFIVTDTTRALSLDAMKSSHPIEVPINDPSEVEEIYDAISYSKSSSIIRMLFSYLGNQVFQNALGSYLQKFKYSNATTLDLWSSLSETSGQDVAAVMRNWTQKQGYPVLKVSGVQEGNTRKLHISQRRFLADGSEDEEGTLWQVPITIITSKSPTEIVQRALLVGKEMEVVVDNVGPEDFVKLNALFSGFYRVQYDDAMLKPLIVAAKNKIIDPPDRFNLAGDLFALARSGAISVTQFFDFLQCLTDETDMNVWLDVDASVALLSNVIDRTSYSASFKKFIGDIYSNIGAYVGWDAKQGESSSMAQLRPVILSRLASCNDATVLAEARRRFEAHQCGSCQLDPNLRGKVFAMMMKQEPATFETLTKLNETSTFAEVQRNCLTAIGQHPSGEILSKALEYALSDRVRLQDLYLVIHGVTNTKEGQEAALKFIKEKIDTIIERAGSDSNAMVVHCVKLACGSHCSEDKAKEVEEFFAKRNVSPGLQRPLNQSLESIRLKASLLARDELNMEQWLKEHGY